MIKVPLKGTYNLMPYKIDPKAPAMKTYKQLPEGMPAEVIDNTLYVMEPVPSYHHADIATELVIKLDSYVRKRKLGKVFYELGLFRKGSVVGPDVVFVSNKNLRFVEHKGLVGPADLCI